MKITLWKPAYLILLIILGLFVAGVTPTPVSADGSGGSTPPGEYDDTTDTGGQSNSLPGDEPNSTEDTSIFDMLVQSIKSITE